MTAAISSTIAAVTIGPSAAPAKGAATNAPADNSAGNRTALQPSVNTHAQHKATAGIANAR